jgi:integrase
MDHPQKAIVRIRVSSKVADFRLHDVRRTVATRLAQLSTLDAILEAALGHTPPKLKRTYNCYQPVPGDEIGAEGLERSGRTNRRRTGRGCSDSAAGGERGRLGQRVEW